jgi:hypothetical protein
MQFSEYFVSLLTDKEVLSLFQDVLSISNILRKN